MLEAANQIKGRLQISTPNFSQIRWVEMAPSGRGVRPVPSDQVFYTRSNTILMPAQVQGSLTIEEWKPLMASSLLYERKILPSLRWKLLPLTMIPLAAFLIMLVVLTIFLGSFFGAIIIYLAVVFVVNMLTTRRRNSVLKRARLESDNQTQTLLGKQSLLAVLKKIDSLGLKDVEARRVRPRGMIYRGLPTVTERIDNLQGFVSNPSY